MIRHTSLTVLLLSLGISGSFAFSPSAQSRRSGTAIGGQPLDRKSFGAQILAVVPTISLLPEIVKADVSDGTNLPQGAQQFQKALRLKTDIPKVRQRVADSASEIDKAEWDNIGKFLRNAYATAEDMKAMAAGIANPDNKKRALQDVDQLKKYSQAGDVSVNKKDGPGFVAVVDKMQELVNDFFDSLSDVPDEI
eukprot:scaffold7970_cov187-Amphora_coffeaeformis.AAC.3